MNLRRYMHQAATPIRSAPLRLRTMAAVVAVTLAALTAFDIGAVTTMRHYLYGQTDETLQTALDATRLKIPSLIPGFAGRARQVRTSSGPPQIRGVPVSSPLKALLGAFDITWVPARGSQILLQAGTSAGLEITPGIAKIAEQPGPHTVVVDGDQAQVRLVGMRLPGGSLVAGADLDQVTNTIVRVELIVMIGSIAVVLLIGGGVFVVLRRGLRPIESMAAQADRITAGDLTDRVTPHSTTTEVGRLGAALNGMLTRIETSVSEREANQAQMRQFFADASHELRTPLAALRASAELYEQGALAEPAELDEVMRGIVAETRRMGRLVDDMLRLARLGQHPAQRSEPVDVTKLVSERAERVRAADPVRRWQVSVADGLATTGDEELLRRAVDNLLTNVLVHTPVDSVAAITATKDGDQVRIEVSDTGQGVAADKLPRIFERFYRADARASRPGSGLGLAIASEIAAAHGGRAEAIPVLPHGLRVTLTLPGHTDPMSRSPSATARAASVSFMLLLRA
jgi:two-component system, OmpR family, sensor kinase